MSVSGVTGVLLVLALAVPLLALLPGYRLSARINVLASFLTFLAALSLFLQRGSVRTGDRSSVSRFDVGG